MIFKDIQITYNGRQFTSQLLAFLLGPPEPEITEFAIEKQVRALQDLREKAQDVGLIDLFCGCGGFSAAPSLAAINNIKGFE